MKNKVYLVLDVENYEFKIFDTAKKAWNCFTEWCRDFDKDNFDEIKDEARILFKEDDYYLFDSDSGNFFIIAGVTIE